MVAPGHATPRLVARPLAWPLVGATLALGWDLLSSPAPGGIARAAVAGREVDLGEAARTQLKLQYYGPPAEGIDLTLVVGGQGPLEVAVEERPNGLPSVPGMTIQPRPASTMPAPFENADRTIVRETFSF